MWIVCYDIPNDKRRTKVMKLLEGFGRRAQYSVFECDIDLTKADQLENRLRALIDEEEDDVRFYPLNKADLKRVRLVGKAELNESASHYIV